MAMACYDAGECDGCMGCVTPALVVCRICGRPIGPHEPLLVTAHGPVCGSVSCQFEAAMEESSDEMLRDYIENDKNSYIDYVFNQG